jgi:hypothetical protein
MIVQDEENTIMGRTEKSTTIITSIEIDSEQPDMEYLLTLESQERLLYGITLILLLVSFMNIYAW